MREVIKHVPSCPWGAHAHFGKMRHSHGQWSITCHTLLVQKCRARGANSECTQVGSGRLSEGVCTSCFRVRSDHRRGPVIQRKQCQGYALFCLLSLYTCMHTQWLNCVWLFATHRLQPARLLCPWDFPGKNTGVYCHFLLHPLLLSYVLGSDVSSGFFI